MNNNTTLIASANQYLKNKYRGQEVSSFAHHVQEVLDAAGLAIEYSSNSHQAIKAYSDIVDFKTLFSNVLNNILIDKWSATTETWRVWVNNYSLTDFRISKITAAGVCQEPDKVLPGAEFTHQQEVNAEQTEAQLETYGNLIQLDRQTIIDDNISTFQSFISGITNAYDRQIGDKVYGFLIDNPQAFGDKQIFQAENSNVVTKTVSFSDDLAKALELIYGQTYTVSESLPKEAALRIQPKYVVVSPAQSLEASKIVGEYNKGLIDGQKLIVLVESRLTGTDSWFVICDNAFSSIALLTLQGRQAPEVIAASQFNTDGVDTKHRFDYDVKPVDYRGLVKVS